MADFPVSTSQDFQPANQKEKLESHITNLAGLHVLRSWPGIRFNESPLLKTHEAFSLGMVKFAGNIENYIKEIVNESNH